jgi:hypothetical protein
MIAREPETFSPSSLSAGTVRAPNSASWIGACSGGGHSVIPYDSRFIDKAFSTAAHGFEPWTTYNLKPMGAEG